MQHGQTLTPLFVRPITPASARKPPATGASGQEFGTCGLSIRLTQSMTQNRTRKIRKTLFYRQLPDRAMTRTARSKPSGPTLSPAVRPTLTTAVHG